MEFIKDDKTPKKLSRPSNKDLRTNDKHGLKKRPKRDGFAPKKKQRNGEFDRQRHYKLKLQKRKLRGGLKGNSVKNNWSSSMKVR